jgi:hypothetical protein
MGSTPARITSNTTHIFEGVVYGSSPYYRESIVFNITNLTSATPVSLSVGRDGTYPLDIYSSAGGSYVASFDNDGDTPTAYGIRIQAGADSGSGTTYYLTALDGDGDVTGYIQTSSGTFQLVDVSDRNTKANIKKRDFNALDKINAVEVVEFNRKQNPGGPKITGFIAQDLQQIYPEAVAVGPDGQLGIAKAELMPLVIKALQEQQAQIDALAQGKPIKTQPAQGTTPTIPQSKDAVVNLASATDFVVTIG